MRNLKKVLTLVLTLAMLLSVMVVGAGAATFGDQESITNKEAVDVCTTLNIIGGYEDGTFRPAGNVTRAEMSKMICVALNGGQEPTMGSNLIATFNDVASTDWSAPYIEYCVSQGIVGGVGGGNFNPTGNITGTQAAKMLLCILGYNASIQGYVGSDYWETNINVDAAQKGLYAGLSNIDASAPLTRDQAAQMIWNALNAYEVEYKTTLVAGPDGNLTSKVTVQDKIGNETLKNRITLLEDKYEAHTAIGIFDGNHNTDKGSIKDGNIRIANTKIDGETPSVGTATPQFKYDLDLKYLGEEVKVLYRDNKDGTNGNVDEKDTIYGVYITGATGVINTTKAKIDDLKTTEQKIKIDGIKYNVADSVDIITNYDVSNPDTKTDTALTGTKDVANSALTTALQANTGDTIKFVKNDKDEISAAYVMESVLGTVTAVNSTKVNIDVLSGSITIADNEVYSGISKDDVVVCTRLYDYNTNLDDAYVIVEKAATVSGVVSGHKVNVASTSSESVTIDGESYNVYGKAAMPVTVAGETGEAYFQNGHIGETFTLYLVNGYVGAAVQTSESANNYSLVIEKNSGTAGASLDALKLVVLGADGTKTTLTVSDKGDKTFTVGDIVTYTGDTDNAKVKKYATETNTGAIGYNKTSKTFAGDVTDTNCVLFQCTDKAFASISTGEKFKAYNIRSLKSFDVTASTYNFVKNDDGKVVAVLVGSATNVTGNTSDMIIGIVSAQNDTVKIGDDSYNQYTVASNDETYTVKVEVNGDTGTKVAKGNVVAFAPASDELYDDDGDFVLLSGAAAYTMWDLTGVKDTDYLSIDGTKYKAATVLVKNYDPDDRLLSYFETAGTVDGTGSVTAEPSNQKNLALDDDCVITYVNVDKDIAGDDMGIRVYDRMTMYYNAIILVNDDDVVTNIIIETSGEGNVFDKNS